MAYLIVFAFFLPIAYFILTASDEKNLWFSLLSSSCMFYLGYGFSFDHRGSWEWFSRWAIMIKHIRYDDVMTPQNRKFDGICGMAMMAVFGLGVLYSIVKLILFYFHP